MSTTIINTAIDQIVRNDHLRDAVLESGAAALQHLDLEPAEAAALAEATRADRGTEPFDHLRCQARFEPMFAAASASATKIG